MTITGQNLNDAELGMLFFVLDGFNSSIYPVTLGGMGGVGFGRFACEQQNVYCLDKNNINDWFEGALQHGHAGYSKIPEIRKEERAETIRRFKNQFLSLTKKGGS